MADLYSQLFGSDSGDGQSEFTSRIEAIVDKRFQEREARILDAAREMMIGELFAGVCMNGEPSIHQRVSEEAKALRSTLEGLTAADIENIKKFDDVTMDLQSKLEAISKSSPESTDAGQKDAVSNGQISENLQDMQPLLEGLTSTDIKNIKEIEKLKTKQKAVSASVVKMAGHTDNLRRLSFDSVSKDDFEEVDLKLQLTERVQVHLNERVEESSSRLEATRRSIQELEEKVERVDEIHGHFEKSLDEVVDEIQVHFEKTIKEMESKFTRVDSEIAKLHEEITELASRTMSALSESQLSTTPDAAKLEEF